MNIWDWLIVTLIAAAVLGAVKLSRKRKKNSCCGACSSCIHHCSAEKNSGNKSL